MAFDFNTLVTDRTQQDVAYAKYLAEKLVAGTATEAEKAEWNSFALKGVYNHTDLNRVTVAMDILKAKMESYGYAVPNYKKIEIPYPSTGGKVRLPDGYLELTYIESTGTQYIDTGYKATSEDYCIKCKFMMVNNASTSVVFGGGASTDVISAMVTSDFQLRFYVASGSVSDSFVYFEKSKQHEMECHANAGTFTVNLDGSNQSGSYSGAINKDYPLFIFANNVAGSASQFSSVRVYGFQIYDNDTLVRDFVPCINSTGIAGLYDMVTAEFYQNAGTGTFTVGNPVTSATQSSSGSNLNSGKVTLRNLVADGSFETTNTWSTWSTDALVTEQSLFGSKSLKLTGDQLAQIPVERPIVGHQYYAREYIKTDGEVTIGDGRFEVHGGDGVGLNWVYGWNRGNYPDWTIQSDVHKIEVVNASSYVMRTFKVGGSGTAYVDGVMLIDLTAAFGSGFEPDKEWCDMHIPFFEGSQVLTLPPRYNWQEYDIPTVHQLSVYLANVATIRSVLAVMETTPDVPSSMLNFMFQEANDIEQILLDVSRQLSTMATTFIPCGEALCGGDNL